MGEISNEIIDVLLTESKDSRLIIMRATDYALLIALTGKNLQIGMVLFELQKTVWRIRCFEPALTSQDGLKRKLNEKLKCL